ncbi:TRAP transporter substrate-binding protein DctP [Pseudohoeflea coraliihabitans]|uniref:TRAP transporter substrate-binding protein DctP n=1 Tax=Pseudohoeflea coraliihabitans TaxID=2860393 RepID=A0ABS6WMS8_9HYPH|nr:TRAP transporter substrate-binding protein DctP [Pseudohoeflea sp. DP4N28-3]MBW3097256.1 TRAP transporter substrate-binding protein DctP [Pseudohoeflea sp. DP4N28-3]
MVRVANKSGLSALAVVLTAGLLTGPAAATDFRMLASWNGTYPVVPNVAEVYMEMVKEASDEQTTISMTGPEAVPPFEQLQPVASGVFDLLFTSGAYHSNETSMGLVMDAVQGDPDGRRSSGVWDKVDAAYQELGLKLIALPTLPEGYNLLLREPIGESCDLAGLKIRGTATYTSLIQSLGAQPVVLPPAEIYSALEKGVVDGAAWPVIGALDYGWFEVADYFLRPAFGTGTYMILMNLEKWDSLDEAEQTLLLDQGVALEKQAIVKLAEVANKEEAALKERGMQATSICGDKAQTVEHDWAEGVWALGIERGGERVKALKEAVTEAGLAF